MSNALEKFGAAVLATPFIVAFAVGLACYTYFAGGYVASCVWSWYAVPLGLMPIGWKSFAAAGMVHRLLFYVRPSVQHEDTREKSTKNTEAIVILIAPWAILLVAWVLR